MEPGAVISLSDTGVAIFWCPGCREHHGVWTQKPNDLTGAKWEWNGDKVKPTFSPSILVRSGHYASGNSGECWCTYNAKHPDEPAPFVCGICHSFVRDGMIQFLDDCTHALAGQTVPLPTEEERPTS